ncbi:bifunctional hydroxymethylpyrimidine kinase/phosphomethylpyrimidine kinase [Nocardioides daeguensis]|uniref:Bifunctional hydroxymethylpyrimidine kinase/phosphomethylpyrimidine kinase n=1 Tax=Nocardioides daeguensis TaxID=908359 RepID=A0ABP6W199_9ACTN|nr:bifunctional hydroxymethylpyrimidine kinase/phosphomethylpyrimidine kinase [Nocardioides daeguensis]MBV6727600.1 bifunctional hydroxymethylpyrimidine kinase/phosphomethylpyrimidine kinase [Nocardioides daeguensis]MCR1771451.1 bifunctional hydroxymethylpyrimidine kinase/phosphomethylpyrimidine kinase [Nocardioides daeguensis]
MTPPVVVTIAATDSGGGAGIAADLATFAALGVHGACVVTAVTAQDTGGVHAIHPVPHEVVAAQLDAVLDDLDPVAVKTGMLATPEVVRLVAERCADRILVVDPVLVATSGAVLASDAVRQAYRDALLPVATVATPNEDELVALGRPVSTNLLVTRGGDIPTTNDHGTGCTHSSALAAYLAHGLDLPTAAARADAFVAGQLRLGKDWTLGRGRGPVAHVHAIPTQGAPA